METSHMPDAAKCGFKIFLGQGTIIPFIGVLSTPVKMHANTDEE